MAKALKILLWLILGFFLLVVILLVVAYFVIFSAGFQKSIVMKALNQPGTQGRVEYIKVGLSKGEIRDFSFFDNRRQGISFDKLAFDYELGALRDNEVIVNRLELSGLLVDMTNATVTAQGSVQTQITIGGGTPADTAQPPQGASGPQAPASGAGTAPQGTQQQPAPQYAGILRSTEMAGMVYRLSAISMDGIVLLPDNIEVRFKAKGDGIAPGAAGTMAAEFTVSNKTPNAPVKEVSGSGTITLSQKKTPGFDKIEAAFNLSGEGAALAKRANLNMTLSIQPTAKGERTELAVFLGEATAPLIGVEAELDAASLTQAGTFAVNTQTGDFAFVPGLDGLPALKLQSKGSFSFANSSQTATLNGDFSVESADVKRTPWPTVRGNIAATHSASEGIRGAMPLTINGPSGVSDMNVTFALKDAQAPAQVKVVDVVLVSQRLFADDLMAMAQAFQAASVQTGAPSSSPSPTGQAPAPSEPVASKPQGTQAPAETKPSVPASVAPDLIPAWHGIAGQVAYTLQDVRFQGRKLEQLKGEIKVSERAITAPSFSGQYQNVKASGNATLQFIAGAPKPYLLTGETSINGLDVGALLRAENPGQQPIIECVADARASFKADAAQLPYLQETLRGDVRFSTGPGTLYPIAAGGSKATTTANLATNLLGGALGGVIPGANKATQVLDYLKTVPFDKAEMVARRDEQLTVFLDSLLIQSPALRFSGSGSIQTVAGTPINEQPLTAQLTLSVAPRSDAAKIFNEAYLLTNRTDAAGFQVGPTFQITGTASDPKTNLGDILLKAGVEALTR